MLAIAVLNLGVWLLLSQNQAILLLGRALILVSIQLHVDPWALVVTLPSTSATWFLPNQTNSYLTTMAGSEGRLFSPAQGSLVAGDYSVVTLIGLAVTVPIWHLVGLL